MGWSLGRNEVEGGEAAAPAAGPGRTDGGTGCDGRAALILLIPLFCRFPDSAVWNGGGACARYLTS